MSDCLIPAKTYFHALDPIYIDQECDRLKGVYGVDGSMWISRLAGRLLDKRGGVYARDAFEWAMRKWEERETAQLAGTGYDPDEETRYLPLK